jgi:predicted nucleic acid-binding protein
MARAGLADVAKAAAGLPHSTYDQGERRILTDFLIGAHAFVNGYKLLTLDARVYEAAFPRLAIRSL